MYNGMEKFNRIFFSDIDEGQGNGTLEFWKSRIYKTFATLLILVGTPLLLIGAIFFLMDGQWFAGIIEITIAVLFLVVIGKFNIDQEHKKLLLVSVLYCFSILLLLTTGSSGAGMPCVLFTLVLSASLLNRHDLIFFSTVNLIAFIMMTLMLYTGVCDNMAMADYKETWLINALTVQGCALLLMFLIFSMFNGIVNQAGIIIESEEKYRFLAEHASDMIWIYNLDKERFTYISSSVEKMRGFTPEEAMAESLAEALTPESYRQAIRSLERNRDLLKTSKVEQESFLVEYQQPCKDGSVLWVECSTNYRFNKDGEIEIIGVSRNIEERKQSENKVVYLSYHDQLTGLYNRRFYEEELKRLDTERNYPITIVMIDVNGLKLVNDAFGHQEGDQLLQQVADVLKNECRTDDILCRIGGDEFVLLLPKTDTDDAKCIIDRVRNGVSGEKNERIILSVAIGYAVKRENGESTEKIFKDAEDMMYNQKMLESTDIRNKTIEMIMESLCARSEEERQHSEMVSQYSAALAEALDLDMIEINKVRLAGLMHDIGKIGIDAALLNKTSMLSASEWREVTRHPEIGYYLLSAVKEYSNLAVYVLEHHERWDGSGYPKGLAKDDISLPARIIAIADAYEAIMAKRPHHNPHGKLEAIDELWANAGTQFDPRLVQIFIDRVAEQQ